MVPLVQQRVCLNRKAQESNNCSVLETGCQDPEEVGSNTSEKIASAARSMNLPVRMGRNRQKSKHFLLLFHLYSIYVEGVAQTQSESSDVQRSNQEKSFIGVPGCLGF